MTELLLIELIEVSPEIWLSCRSSEAAISSEMVSGEAPGSWVLTSMVGKSTSGSAETGSFR